LILQILAQAWTLAVEEQFYIIWAVLLPVIASGKLFRRTIILGAIFTISIVYRMAMYRSGDSDMMSKSLLANSYALVAGSCLRLLPSPSWMHTPKAAYVGQILFVITVLCMRVDAWAYSGCIYGPFSAVIATLLTITGSVAGGNWILETSLLRHFGRISYTLYLWHHVFLWLIGSFNQVNIHSVGAICISYLIAETSTIYIEEPIRERFKSTQWFKMQKQKVARNHALDGGIVRS
jgi:peptidoglycan/LPS O-acetylase OafA/YrhL